MDSDQDSKEKIFGCGNNGIEVMKKSLQEFYSSRNKDAKVRIKPRELRGGLAI